MPQIPDKVVWVSRHLKTLNLNIFLRCKKLTNLLCFQSVKTLGVFQKPGLFDKGVGALLPEAYKKFYKEWRLAEPSAVHYVPEEGKFKRNELTGEVYVVHN